MSDVVRVACTSCGQVYKVPPTKQGQQAVCKKCGKPFVIAEIAPIELMPVAAQHAALTDIPSVPTTAASVAAPDAPTFDSQFVEVAPRDSGFASLFGKIKGAVTQAAKGAREAATNAQSQVASSFACAGCDKRLSGFELSTKLGRCARCSLGNSGLLDDASSEPTFTQSATYKGGLPAYPESGRHNGFAYVFEDAFRFVDDRMTWVIPHDRIRGVDQETYQISGARAVLAGINAVALKQVRNTLAIRFIDPEGFEQVVRFQIHGAMTIPGEEAKASEFLSHLSRFRARWMANAPTAGGTAEIDIEARLERLERLREKGMIGPEEYAAKRSELLDLL